MIFEVFVRVNAFVILLQVGPMVTGITPQEASERLNTFQVITSKA